MKLNKEFLLSYLAVAPLALAVERTMECHVLAQRQFERPVLDLGCGDGIFAKILFGEKVDTGLEPNPAEIARAGQSEMYHELLQCAGSSVPKPDSFYRTIISNSVLEHIPDLSPVLREVHRLLAPGGQFLVTVPSDRFDHYSVVNQILTFFGFRGIARRYRNFFNSFWKHYHCYSREEWQKLFQQCGFQIVESYEYNPKLIAVLNDLMAPFGFLSVIWKSFIGRWTLFPPLRRMAFWPIHRFLSPWIRKGIRVPEGGLVFLAATR